MNKRTAAILLKVIGVQALGSGLDFTGYLVVEHLVTYLIGAKESVWEIRDEKDRQSCLIGILLLASIRGNWIDLQERIKLSPETTQRILDTNWLPDTRTYNSWKAYHSPRQHLEIMTVPMESYSQERDPLTTRYSGYTKHYGNGGHISRVQKTSYNSELDGESTDAPPPVFTLVEMQQYNSLLLAIEREKAERRAERE